MKTDLFTFSIQEAETLGIECAIVLAASKDLKNSPAMPNEMALLIKEKIPFFEEREIISHLKINVPTYKKNQLPESLRSKPIIIPGSRFVK